MLTWRLFSVTTSSLLEEWQRLTSARTQLGSYDIMMICRCVVASAWCGLRVNRQLSPTEEHYYLPLIFFNELCSTEAGDMIRMVTL